jgi:hypothetical protein
MAVTELFGQTDLVGEEVVDVGERGFAFDS